MSKLRSSFAKELYVLAGLFVAFYLVFNLLMPAILGVSNPIATVNGPSMEPTFHDGDLVILIGVRPEDVKVGDVIVYSANWAGGEDVIHRVVAVERRDGQYLFRVQGDNRKTNPVPDPGYVTADEIRGKVIFGGIPLAGRILSMVQSIPGKVTVVAILVALLIRDYVDYKREEEKGGGSDGNETSMGETGEDSEGYPTDPAGSPGPSPSEPDSNRDFIYTPKYKGQVG